MQMMQLIEEYMEVPLDFRLRQRGTQEYEADVVILEQRGKNTLFFDPAIACAFVCART